MDGTLFTLSGATLVARGTGALWWPEHRTLCVSDLHLGRAARMARHGGSLLPPFETEDTLQRLDAEIAALAPACVICLGDSFDDTGAADALPEAARLWIARMQAGRRWVWIEGNHDPGPVDLGGRHAQELRTGPLVFRHIARPDATGEVSGHYHPKAGLATRAGRVSRPCFLIDPARVILPAFGTYTGGLAADAAVFDPLMSDQARALMIGPGAIMLPRPRKGPRRAAGGDRGRHGPISRV